MPTGLKIREASETLGRRNFFRCFAGRAIGSLQEIGGSPQLRLDQMASLPEPVMRTLRPVMDALGPYRIEGGQLIHAVEGRVWLVHSFEPWEIAAISRFDGHGTLAEISSTFASAQGLSPDDAYRDVKSLFLALASYMLCRPANTGAENVTDPSQAG